jgi:NAD(P)H-hydrate epimerase
VEAPFELYTVSAISQMEVVKEYIQKSTFIVDGIFGTGVNKNITGIYKHIIEEINHSGKKIYAIDLPSGIDSNNGIKKKHAVKADVTGVIGAYKVGNFLGDALDFSGKLVLIPIDLQFDEIRKAYKLTKEVFPLLKTRKDNSHKYEYGNVISIGGSFEYFGAINLSAFAALRCGTGLSSVAVNEDDVPFISPIYPELILSKYKTKEELFTLVENKNAVLFGPGLHPEKAKLEFLEMLISTHKPLVIDGGGIELLKEVTIPLHKNIVITPHLGELAKYFGLTSKTVQKDPVKYITKLSKKGITVVLKGATTIIQNKANMIFMKTGNPGMATSGMGDVLSGIILSFLGNKFSPYESALYGVSLHSKAGNLGKEEKGESSLVASDLYQYIPEILKLGENQ